MNGKKRLLIIADAAVDTGFASVTHNLVKRLAQTWDIAILAINYYGDPHPIQQYARLYNPTALSPTDYYGLNRVNTLLHTEKPDIVLVINDPWVAMDYVPTFKDTPGKKVLYVPVDAENLKPAFVKPLNNYDAVISYTEFGKQELLHAGLDTVTDTLLHGVDLTHFLPVPKEEARAKSNLDPDWFIVQVADRNAPRKRIDLALYYFAEWVKRTNKPKNVKFYYHGALKDEGYDIVQLAAYLDVEDRVAITSPHITPSRGIPVELLKYVYSVADIGLSTSIAEGFGLTTLERMACGVPMLIPEHSAYAEWPRGAVHYIKTSPIPYFGIKGLNTHAQVPDIESAIHGLEFMYQNPQYRRELSEKGLELAKSDTFSWDVIARKFDNIFRNHL